LTGSLHKYQILPEMSAFKSFERYIDPESGRLSSYFSKLFILIGDASLQYCLLDTDRNTFVALADFRLPSLPKSKEAFYAEISQLLSEDDLLKKKYPSVVIGLDSLLHTLVPAPLFEPEQPGKYLEFNFGKTGDGEVRVDHLEEIESFNVYGIPVGSLDIVKNNFGEAAIFHRSSALIRAIYNLQKINPAPADLYLNVREQFIDLASIQGGRLIFFNSYSCTGKEDMLYYTLYAMEQLNLRPGNSQLSVSGNIDIGSESHRLLEQYINPLLFPERLNLWDYSPFMGQSPAYRYLELFALALCGL
jgi:hypothetical protein